MTCIKPLKVFSIAMILLAFVALSSTIVSAQTKSEGVIKGRSGAKIILQAADSSKVVVLLTDSRDLAQVQGAFKARKKDMSMAALIPGLLIKVEGTYDAQNQLVAKTIRFKGNDFEQAQAIQAMGESHQIGKDNSAESDAENRRVVVRILQNKGIAGL